MNGAIAGALMRGVGRSASATMLVAAWKIVHATAIHTSVADRMPASIEQVLQGPSQPYARSSRRVLLGRRAAAHRCRAVPDRHGRRQMAYRIAGRARSPRSRLGNAPGIPGVGAMRGYCLAVLRAEADAFLSATGIQDSRGATRAAGVPA